MSFINTGSELAQMGPGVLGLQMEGIGDTLRIGSIVLGAVSGTFYSLFRSFKQVPEGYVGIRTFNGRALDKDGEPLHELLEPGGHWMVPFLHDVEMVNRQHQTSVVETTVDMPHDNGFEQYKLGAVATWGVLSDRSGVRPIVEFEDAYKHFYGIDTAEDLETKVAGAATRYLIDCALKLEAKDRNVGVLNGSAEKSLDEGVDGLEAYGVGIHGIEVTEFSRAGVVQLGASSLELRVTTNAVEIAGRAQMN